MTKQEAIQQQIDDIMDTFEFSEIRDWMISCGWCWGGPDGSNEVPELYEIRQRARDRLKEAAKTGFSSTGGFTAFRTEGRDENGPWIVLQLYFGYQSVNDGTSYTE